MQVYENPGAKERMFRAVLDGLYKKFEDTEYVRKLGHPDVI